MWDSSKISKYAKSVNADPDDIKMLRMTIGRRIRHLQMLAECIPPHLQTADVVAWQHAIQGLRGSAAGKVAELEAKKFITMNVPQVILAHGCSLFDPMSDCWADVRDSE
ncbi:MAG: hypothetical protein EBU84_08250 [Actinobacteria bacterium]|nr:hypothetical protein [Actinomycetota bacterium]